MKSIYLFLIMVFVFCFCSCETVHHDCMITFNVQGVVFNKDNKTPIESAKVLFVDTGYDSLASQGGIQEEIGTTDLQGRIDIKFDYGYSYEEGWGYEKPKDTFEIHIYKESYKKKVLLFKESDFKKEEHILYVDLSEIYLEEE